MGVTTKPRRPVRHKTTTSAQRHMRVRALPGEGVMKPLGEKPSVQRHGSAVMARNLQGFSAGLGFRILRLERFKFRVLGFRV